MGKHYLTTADVSRLRDMSNDVDNLTGGRYRGRKTRRGKGGPTSKYDGPFTVTILNGIVYASDGQVNIGTFDFRSQDLQTDDFSEVTSDDAIVIVEIYVLGEWKSRLKIVEDYDQEPGTYAVDGEDFTRPTFRKALASVEMALNGVEWEPVGISQWYRAGDLDVPRIGTI